MNRFRVWTCVFLASLTTACASPQPLKVTEYVNVYIPDSMLGDCAKTERVPGGTFRQAAALAAARGTDLDNCSERWRGVRAYQDRIRADEVEAKARAGEQR